MLSVTTKEKEERFSQIIGNAMAYVANEALILAQMEEFFSPSPASLWNEDEEESIYKRLDNAVENMGGPPKLILKREDDPPPICDTYPEAALREMISAFHRARKSVCRAHLFMTGSSMLQMHPELLEQTGNEEADAAIASLAEKAFWEHAETGFIRLASYWDRVGQVLDFAFFGIRQYERDGFSAVIDRIRTNIVQMNTQLERSDAWKAIRSYQTSERDDGLKWLLRRRNIIVHSLHLRPSEQSIDEIAYKPMYNHLEEKLENKLMPRTPEGEIKQLHAQLSKAAELFKSILTLIELA